MPTQHRSSINLLFTAIDLPVWSSVETVATLYPQDRDRHHLVLTEPFVRERELNPDGKEIATLPLCRTPRLLWLELSPYRVSMTMQGNGHFSYRHLWERGVYGLSRYWLPGDSMSPVGELRLRNFTRSLTLQGSPLPTFLRVEYELWADKIQLGQYVVNLDIQSEST
jgi:hypothetical protein